jgi:hypothetical protein
VRRRVPCDVVGRCDREQRPSFLVRLSATPSPSHRIAVPRGPHASVLRTLDSRRRIARCGEGCGAGGCGVIRGPGPTRRAAIEPRRARRCRRDRTRFPALRRPSQRLRPAERTFPKRRGEAAAGPAARYDRGGSCRRACGACSQGSAVATEGSLRRRVRRGARPEAWRRSRRVPDAAADRGACRTPWPGAPSWKEFALRATLLASPRMRSRRTRPPAPHPGKSPRRRARLTSRAAVESGSFTEAGPRRRDDWAAASGVRRGRAARLVALPPAAPQSLGLLEQSTGTRHIRGIAPRSRTSAAVRDEPQGPWAARVGQASR